MVASLVLHKPCAWKGLGGTQLSIPLNFTTWRPLIQRLSTMLWSKVEDPPDQPENLAEGSKAKACIHLQLNATSRMGTTFLTPKNASPFKQGHRKVEQSWRPKILGKSAFCFAIIMPLIRQNNGSQVPFWSNTKIEGLCWFWTSTWLLGCTALRTLTWSSSSVVQMNEQVLFFLV